MRCHAKYTVSLGFKQRFFHEKLQMGTFMKVSRVSHISLSVYSLVVGISDVIVNIQ